MKSFKKLVESFQKDGKPIRLHLGCGDQYFDGWINTDNYVFRVADAKLDAMKIPLEDDSVDELWASHIIEHFNFYEGFDVLKEWYRVMKVNSKLSLETPDFLGACKLFVEGDERLRINLYGHFFAMPWEKGNTHKFLYTETQLRWTLDRVGFRNTRRVQPDSVYARTARLAGSVFDSIFLKVETFK
jgi:predicted SAM-dependent methyltransferase